MKALLSLFGIVLLFVSFACKNATQPNNTTDKLPKLTIKTDSALYLRSSGITRVKFEISNHTDSTLYFPSCGLIHSRIDTIRAENLFKGYPGWESACVAIWPSVTAVLKDSLYTGVLTFNVAGTFRIVTIYSSTSGGTFRDTLISNQFTVQ